MSCCGIDEAQFMRETQGTFKLGIEFRAGIARGSYIHPFGAFGELWGGVEFQHFWLRARQQGLSPPPLEDFSVAVRACRAQCLRLSEPAVPSLSTFYSYAYHFDAEPVRGLPAPLGDRTWRHAHRGQGGRRRVDRAGRYRVADTESGQRIAGDFFVDCSGFRSLLLGDKLQVPWEDWSSLAALRPRLGRAL